MKLWPWTAIVLLPALALAVLQRRRAAADEREVQQAWSELLQQRVALPGRFDAALLAGLPEPARRFFSFAIEPGTRLGAIVELTMAGELSLGSKAEPKYQAMRARQVLAAPHGFVWQVEAGAGAMRISGSDGLLGNRSWTRFWLLRLLPVARVGGDPDHLRSAFGRMVAEAAFWTPAFLLPRPGVAWSAVDADTARVTVTHGALEQSVDIRVDRDGQPVSVCMPRWSNANADKVYRVQPFGGELSDFRPVAGYRLPFRVDGGNFFGTPEYFPFYRARVLEVSLRGLEEGGR